MENNTQASAVLPLTRAKALRYAEEIAELDLPLTLADISEAYVNGASATLTRIRGMIEAVGRMGGLSPQQVEMLIDVTCILDV